MIFLIWYLGGMLISLYWPYRYRYDMQPGDWEQVFRMMPIQGFFGPFAIITSFPV